MSASPIFDTTIQTLEKALSLRSQKLQIISANIANAETPGYSRMKMDFEKALAGAANGNESGPAATHPRHFGFSGKGNLGFVEAEVYREPAQSVIGDGNNVVLEQEMTDLSENRIRYEAAIRMLSKKFNMLKTVIQERA
ncbi:MAG: flagellar basal body rod protein FlgB [Desulfobacteraceae bacterium]|nr:flagellar basal body rod protein FlgB [Desulfobacteraceae bacterium]MCF8094277.1 flagellar basal body rod protein FlgB [Desulfobacteraceae bacterium]